MDGVTVRFLQPSTPTGGTVEVEVALSAPATTDVRLSVRLAPGSGDDPAVAGVDYVDEPALVHHPPRCHVRAGNVPIDREPRARLRPDRDRHRDPRGLTPKKTP